MTCTAGSWARTWLATTRASSSMCSWISAQRFEEAGARVTYANLPVLYGDPTQLHQLLQDLISNSVKYRRADQPCEIAVRAERGADGWTIRVEDNGRGIDAQQRERAFAMYARLD